MELRIECGVLSIMVTLAVTVVVSVHRNYSFHTYVTVTALEYLPSSSSIIVTSAGVLNISSPVMLVRSTKKDSCGSKRKSVRMVMSTHICWSPELKVTISLSIE